MYEKERKKMSTETMNKVNTKEQVKKKDKMSVRTIAQIGMLGAVAMILMKFEIPLPFAPSFYKIDFSEVPVLIGSFAMGPVAGVFIELVKILLKVLIKGSTTAGVGDVANFLIGISFCLPAAVVYKKLHSKKGAIIGMAAGIECITDFLLSSRLYCRFWNCTKSATQIYCAGRGLYRRLGIAPSPEEFSLLFVPIIKYTFLLCKYFFYYFTNICTNCSESRGRNTHFLYCR